MSYLIYLRKSRKDMDSPDSSIEDILGRHEHILLTLAQEQNLIIGAIYKEVVSGDSISGRPYMQRLLREVESGMWDGVLVVEVERLARGDTIDQGLVQRAFQYSNTLIITPTKTYNPANESDQEYFEFGLFMSRREYKTIKRRLQSGRCSAAAEGKWPFNSAPYGYRRVKLKGEKGWTLDFDEKEQPVAELIYQLVAEKGFGIARVRDYLNNNGIKPRKSNVWTDSTLRDFIANPVYDGMVFIGKRKTVTTIQNGIPVQSRPRDNNYLKTKGLHPALVSHETFLAAQQQIGNGFHRTSHTIKNPLSGLLICQQCGHLMQRRPATASDVKNGTKYDVLMCRTPGCSTIGSSLNLVELEVIHVLEQLIAGYEFSSTSDRHSLIPQKEKLLNQALEEQKELMSQKERLYTLLEQGIYTTEIFLERSNILKQKLQESNIHIKHFTEDLEKERQKEQNGNIFVPNCNELLRLYWTLTPEHRNRALKEAISKIVYRKQTKNKKGHGNEAAFELTLYPKIPQKQ